MTLRHPYAFKCRGGSEFRAADKLLRYGVMPSIPAEYRYARKVGPNPVLQCTPTMHGYFVGLIDLTRWHDIREARYEDGTRILGKPISIDGTMRPLPWDTWRDIMDLASYSDEVPDIVPNAKLRPGQTVILKGGAHAGKRVRIQKTSRNGSKAKVLLELFGSMREVEITAAQVEAA